MRSSVRFAMAVAWIGVALGLGAVAHGQGVPPSSASRAPKVMNLKALDRMKAARLQTLLARAGFSPGLIDGKPGRKTGVALAAARTSEPMAETLAQIEAAMEEPGSVEDSWVASYRITPADLGWVTGPIPENWNERAQLEKSGYADLTELLAERGWCSVEMVRTLNPGVELNALSAGDVVKLPAVQDAKALPRLSRVEVDLAEKLVKGFDSGGQLVSLMHCSIARLQEKRPVGELKVIVVVVDPDYTFDPKDWPEVTNVTKRLRISPGPRCPVGSAWVGLDKPGYGLHGTIRPQDIGKTGSHGCFRLPNWEAVRLAKAVKLGTVVDVRD